MLEKKKYIIEAYSPIRQLYVRTSGNIISAYF